MSGTLAGGKKAAATTMARHGSDFFREIGRKGGKNGHTGGFAANRELARIAGAKGGRISRRGPGKKAYNERTTWVSKAKTALDSIASRSTSRSSRASQDHCVNCGKLVDRSQLGDDGLCLNCPSRPDTGFDPREASF